MLSICVHTANNLFTIRNKICAQSYTGVSNFVTKVMQAWVQPVLTRPFIHPQVSGFYTGNFNGSRLLNIYLYPQSTEPINNHNKRKNEKGNN